MPFHSQIQQDSLLDAHIFHGLRNGVFVELGALDGVKFSNTLFFEQERGWTGICIEPDPTSFAKLRVNRPTAVCLQVAAAGASGPREFILGEEIGGFAGSADLKRINREKLYRGHTTVLAMTLDMILKDSKVEEVHYLSLDVEGAEKEVLGGINFSAVTIHAMTIECNDPRDQAAMVDAVGPRFALAGRHAFDLFFLLRESPFATGLDALSAAIAEANRPIPRETIRARLKRALRL